METVVVERLLSEPRAFESLDAVERRSAACFHLRGVRAVRSYFSRDGRRLILVVNGLAMGKPQHEGGAIRARETTRLLEWGFREFTNTTLFKAGDTVAEAPVWLGTQDKVPLVTSRSLQMTLPTGQAANARVVAKFDGPIAAPIAKGTKLGSAAVTLPDGRVMEYPIEAGIDVPRQGFVGRVFSLARHYLVGWISS